MGVGNRFKKQGPPGPLDETLITRKRKDAPPVAEQTWRRKRSRTEIRTFKKKEAANTNPISFEKATVREYQTKAKPIKKLIRAHVSNEEISDTEDFEITMQAANVTTLDALGSSSESDNPDDDEFADSDSDIVDSDTDVQKISMWSDDDEDEAKEKLTAANIEGLSRKLDMQKAVEDAEAQAELEEAALTTNIAGDRPTLLEDEEDEDGQPISKLVTQDLQLLRTRINDTIRVLDDWKNLGEDGRSRAEYRELLLKDVCAYYGYSEYLVSSSGVITTFFRGV